MCRQHRSPGPTGRVCVRVQERACSIRTRPPRLVRRHHCLGAQPRPCRLDQVNHGRGDRSLSRRPRIGSSPEDECQPAATGAGAGEGGEPDGDIPITEVHLGVTADPSTVCGHVAGCQPDCRAGAWSSCLPGLYRRGVPQMLTRETGCAESRRPRARRRHLLDALGRAGAMIAAVARPDVEQTALGRGRAWHRRRRGQHHALPLESWRGSLCRGRLVDGDLLVVGRR
jgi:hypothetical protein